MSLCRALEPLGWNGDVVALAEGSEGGLPIPVLGPSRFAADTLKVLRRSALGSSLVVAHGSSTLPAVALATAGTGVPFVYRSVGDPRAWVTTPPRRLRVSASARRAASVVTLWRGSAVTWHRVLGIRPERITVIPNGVEADRFTPAGPDRVSAARAALGLPLDRVVVVCIGALSREKRFDLALRAVAAVDGVTLAIVGAGPERERLAALGSEILGARVRFLGSTDAPGEALAAADVVLVPSETEGQPAVAIEAGLSGLPVVGTRVGGMADVVLHDRSGVLVEQGNAQALALGILRALARREEMGAAAREHCLTHFDMNRIAGRWSALLQSLVKT